MKQKRISQTQMADIQNQTPSLSKAARKQKQQDRLADNLRANLRRRKAALRKVKAQSSTTPASQNSES